MSKEKKRPSLRISSGITSLMMVFVVLCMTVFATLNYVQANRNSKMIKATTEQAIAYSNAEYQASKFIEELLEKLSVESSEHVLNEYQTSEDTDNMITKTFTINSNKELIVGVKIINQKLDIVTWSVVVTFDGDYGMQGLDY